MRDEVGRGREIVDAGVRLELVLDLVLVGGSTVPTFLCARSGRTRGEVLDGIEEFTYDRRKVGVVFGQRVTEGQERGQGAGLSEHEKGRKGGMWSVMGFERRRC